MTNSFLEPHRLIQLGTITVEKYIADQLQYGRSRFAARNQRRRRKVRVVQKCGRELSPNTTMGQLGEALLQPVELRQP
jgi:hypothetical protein